jgi:hypothetical protein
MQRAERKLRKYGYLLPATLHSLQADGFAMLHLKKICVPALVLLAASLSGAAERPTLKKTRDPRPDIIPHPIWDAHTEYRQAYNRPRFTTGWIAAQIAPSSLEAMVWYENLQCGRYDEKHMPPMCKTYYYPKPWEVLDTGPRPDFPDQANAQRIQQTTGRTYDAGEPESLNQRPVVPMPVK